MIREAREQEGSVVKQMLPKCTKVSYGKDSCGIAQPSKEELTQVSAWKNINGINVSCKNPCTGIRAAMRQKGEETSCTLSGFL